MLSVVPIHGRWEPADDHLLPALFHFFAKAVPVAEKARGLPRQVKGQLVFLFSKAGIKPAFFFRFFIQG